MMPCGDVFIKSNSDKTSKVSFRGNVDSAGDKKCDTRKFGKYFEEKIKTSLKDTSAQEIATTVKNVCKRTGTDEETARNTISRLTQFSGWSQLPAIGNELDKLDIHSFSNELCSVKVLKTTRVSLHDVLKYLHNSKHQIPTNPKKRKTALVVDKNFLDNMREMKDNDYREYEKMKLQLSKDELRLILIDGFNPVSKDGKDVSQGLFGSSISLEDSACEVISRMQNENITLDEALNGDIKADIKEVFGEDVPIYQISNETVKGNNDKDIAKRLSTKHPSAQEITAVIDAVVETSLEKYPDNLKNRGKQLLCDYSDNMLSCFSRNTLSEELQKIHTQIKDSLEQKGKTEDDVLYLVPVHEKSFDLISYQYAKVNDISSDKFLYFDGKSKLLPPDLKGNKTNLKGKTVVILDDIAGSANTMLKQGFDYYNFKKNFPGNDVIFAPVSSLASGYKNIKGAMMDVSGYHDNIFSNNIVDYRYHLGKLDNKDAALLLKLLGHSGYANAYACTAMPYMLPDNNSEFSALLLSGFLNNNTDGGNKARKRYQELEPLVKQKINMNII